MDDFETRKDATRAAAKPEEWCGECDDWSDNCECDEDDGEFAREREDERKFLAGDGYDHDRGVCEGPGCCRYCDAPPDGEPRPMAGREPVGAW